MNEGDCQGDSPTFFPALFPLEVALTRPNDAPSRETADRRSQIADVVELECEIGRIGPRERHLLAEKWGKTESFVERWLGRHHTEIWTRILMRRSRGDQTEEFWLAQPDARIRQRQAHLDLMDSVLAEAYANGARIPWRGLEISEHIRANVAREFGQIVPPPPAPVEQTHVTYVIEGMDPNQIWGPNPNRDAMPGMEADEVETEYQYPDGTWSTEPPVVVHSPSPEPKADPEPDFLDSLGEDD